MPEDNSENQNWPLKPKISRKKIIKHIKKAETATMRHTHKFLVRRWENVREVRSKVVSWIVLMGVLIAATGFQMMWFQKSYLSTAQADDGTYAEAVLGPVDTLNPLFAMTDAEKSASYLLFSSLLRYDESGHLNNDIASKVSVDETGKIYTISIRPDVKWHDGENLTTDDIAYTIDLIKDESTNSTITGWLNISVKVIDNKTIQFTLPSVYAAFDHALTFPILPKHILGSVEHSQIRENAYSQNPIGSGPFKMRFIQNVESTKGQKIIYLARNDQFYGGKAKLAKLQLNAYSTADDIKKALLANQVNATADLSYSDVKQLDVKKYSVVTKPIQSGVYALINTKSAILSDVKLRRALQLATNTSEIINKLPEGTPSLNLPFTEGQLSGDVPTVPKFDIEAAKNALNDNGWINGDGVREKDGKKLTISVIVIKGSELESVVELLSTQWKAVGFDVELKVVDLSDVTQNVVQNILQPRNYDVLVYQLDIGADPDVYAYWNSTQMTSMGLNYSNYSNIISDDALTSARSRTEPDIRNAKYITFVKQWINDVPAIGLYQSTIQYVYSSSVHAFNKSNVLISPVDRYSDILEWSVGDKTVYKTP
jgi:peptide/nickel transport system substrate-binding protein